MKTLRVRRVTCWAVALLVLILATTALERRVAEADFNDDFGCFLENAYSIDGDEILSRLILLNDLALPAVSSDTGTVVALVATDKPEAVVGSELAVPGSRAPPVVAL